MVHFTPHLSDLCYLEAGSFRDRNNRVFYHQQQVYRGLSQQAWQEWQKLAQTSFFSRLMEEGRIVQTTAVEDPPFEDPEIREQWAAFLHHQTIPFISYPYEWPFGMLKEAALLHLELLQAALAEDMILKDATAYNIQWLGTNPVFIDVTSFETLEPGTPWVGYRQFCQMFLYPLMLQAYKNIDFHPLLRGDTEGVDAQQCSRMMSARDWLRPGVFFHVMLQANMQEKAGSQSVKQELKHAGFHKELIVNNLRKLQQIIRPMTMPSQKSVWSDYAENNSYTDDSRQQKRDFVRQAVMSQPWNQVWDLGSNTGEYARIAAENAAYVLAMDADHLAVERLYQQLKREGHRHILPLVNNVTNPSPSQGWRGQERKSLADRGKPDLVLALALVHHVVIGANIPLREFVAWLGELGASVAIEFVTRADPMVQTLLRNKVDQYTDYDQDYFEQCLAHWFEIRQVQAVIPGQRTLYFAAPKR